MTRSATLWLLVLALGVAVALVFTLRSAPKQAPEAAPTVSAATGIRPGPTDAPAAVKSAQRSGFDITLYFPSQRYIESGDESLPQLIGEPHRVELETNDGSAIAEAALKALQAGPKSSAAAPAIPTQVRIRHVEVRDRTARVDFARAGLSGGSLEERLLVESIVKTLTQLPAVRQVQFLIEGRVAETLMGHVATDQPISAVE